MRYVQAEVRRICRAAGLPDGITFTSFRHGGHTEGADSDLTNAQMRALGGHKTTAALLRYAKETDEQRQTGARKRRDARTKKGDNEQVTICQNDNSEPAKSLMRWWAHQGSNLGPDD